MAVGRWTTRGMMLVAALAASTTSSALGPGGSAGAVEAGDTSRAAKPVTWRSYPLNHRPNNLAGQAKRDACNFEHHQRVGTKAVLIFLVGRVNKRAGNFGVGADSSFNSNKKVLKALLAAGNAYDRCRGPARKKVRIAYGVTNYELSQELGSNWMARRAGRAQYEVAAKLKRRFPNGVNAALAVDIEPGWDPMGSGDALSLTRAAAHGRLPYFNIGTAGHCPPYGTSCQGNWTHAKVGQVSQDKGIIPLPQVYFPRQARTWKRVADRWDREPGNCRRQGKRGCFDFGGVTTQPQSCGAHYKPRAALRRMRKVTHHRVGNRIIYFNPRGVGC